MGAGPLQGRPTLDFERRLCDDEVRSRRSETCSETPCLPTMHPEILSRFDSGGLLPGRSLFDFEGVHHTGLTCRGSEKMCVRLRIVPTLERMSPLVRSTSVA